MIEFDNLKLIISKNTSND